MGAAVRQPRVCVVGSVNVDIVHSVATIPTPGETVASKRVVLHAGGKGLNQAIAAARSGVSSALVACIGSDERSSIVLDAMDAAGLDRTHLRRVEGSTGTATVLVDEDGENAIIVDAGANGAMAHLGDRDLATIRRSDVVVAQFEIGIEVVVEAAVATRASGGTFVLNPTPPRHIPAELLHLVDILVLNEHEARHLGIEQKEGGCVITTRGAAGAGVRFSDGREVDLPARETRAVDTTGAGDVFVGVLAADVALGQPIEAAARRAVVAASLAVEREGAVDSIPTRDEVDAAIARWSEARSR